MFKFFDISLNKNLYTEDLKNIIIVLTFFWLWLSTQLSSTVQDYVAYGLILTFGVLHGANDIAIISSITKGRSTLRGLLFPYLGAILLVSLLFFISKGIALLFFILISAYHFGEQHLGRYFIKDTGIRPIVFLSYGLSILFIIFNIKINRVLPIIEDVTGVFLPVFIFQIVLILASTTMLFLSIFLIKTSVLIVNPLKELFYLGVLALVFANSSLLWGFATYFILWHSLPSMNDQLGHLYGEANRTSLFKYLRSSALYWLMSIVGLGVLYWLLRDSVDYFITVVLYVLAAVTFPHVVVMSKVEGLRSSRES